MEEMAFSRRNFLTLLLGCAPAALADVILFLASDAARAVSGVSLPV